MNFRRLYTKSSQASILIPVYAGIRNYKALTKPFKILFYFFVLTILFEIQAALAAWLFNNNMPGQHVYTLIQFLVFSTLFFLHINQNKWLQRLIFLNAGIFMVVAFADMYHNINTTNDMSRGYAGFFMTIYTLGYLYYLFTRDAPKFISDYPMFWICAGTLVYFTVNAIYAMTKDFLLEKYPDVEAYFDLGHSVLNIIANCLYAQAFRCLGKQKA